jgi:excisionase family DNA binding protein
MSAEARRDCGARPVAALPTTLPSAAAIGEQGSGVRLLTAEDLAARWQVPCSHVYRLARDGKLPVVRLGRYRRFRLAEIEAFEASGGVSGDA